MANKVILTAAVTGAVHIPSMSPYLPDTPDKIIDEAVAACEAGAAVVHLHARDPKDGRPSSDTGLMKYITDGVRARCDVVVGITTGGAIGMNIEERLASVRCARRSWPPATQARLTSASPPLPTRSSNPSMIGRFPL